MSRQKSSPAVDEMTTASILEYFAAVPDPRIDRRRLHPLTSILALSPVAVICGADSFVAIEEFGESKEAWLKTFLDFPNGIPSHDTLGRVFAILDPVALAEEARKDPKLLASMDFHSTDEKGHGRREVRRCWTTSLVESISQRAQWQDLRTLVLIESERTVDGKTTLEQRRYICSRSSLSAKSAMADARSHRGIENGLHRVLDIAFREDDRRIRAGHAGESFAVMRHIAINLLKAVKGTKVGIKNRRLRAGWDQAFLLRVLGALS